MAYEVDDIIAKNKGLVFKQLHKFGLAKDHEAESLGYEALYNAAMTFENEKGIKFSTYATVCIYNALGSYTRTINRQRQLRTVSYYSLSYNSDGDSTELLSHLACVQDTEADYLREETCKEIRKLFKQEFDKVTNQKHKKILAAWDESNFTISTSDIARMVGVSQSYVSQVLNNFKYSMRKRLEV